MKKLIFTFLIIPFFFYGCDPEDTNNNNNSDTVKVDEVVTPPSDTTEITLTEDEVDMKTNDLLQKSEDINKKLDELINNL
jgi:hypothetical protein